MIKSYSMLEMFVILRLVRRLNLKNTRQRLILFIIVGTVCACGVIVFGYRGSGIGFVQQNNRRQSWTVTDDDESLLQEFVVQPPSVEHSLPIRIGLTAVDGVWQQVPETKSELHVYSAHLDTRIESVGPLIRVIGTAKTRDPDEVWCRLWYAADGSNTVSAQVVAMQEHKHLQDAAVFVLCKLPPLPDKRYPSSVSIVARVKDPINNELTVQVPDTTGGFAAELGICVKPFHGRYDTETRLMEFVELNRLLGVGHFTFYNGSVAPNVQCVLDRYKRDGLISVLPWHLDLVTSKSELTGTEGQFAAINDCLYRNMYKARHVAFVDLDEFIVPKRHNTLLEMIKSCEPPPSNRSSLPTVATAAYVFRHAFFCMEWPDDDVSAALQDANRTASELVVLRKTLRRSVVHEYGARSKFVCDPRRTVEVGDNFVRRFLDAERDATFDVPADVAMLHHYAYCADQKPYYAADAAEDFVADRTMYRHQDRLVDGVTRTRGKLDEECVREAERMNGYYSKAHPKTGGASGRAKMTNPRILKPRNLEKFAERMRI